MSDSDATTDTVKSGTSVLSDQAARAAALAKTLPTSPAKALTAIDPSALGAEVASSGWLGSVWFWVAIIVALVTAGAGVFFWRKRKGGLASLWPKAKAVVLEYDPRGDYATFRSRLPREFERALDEFQFILVLGNNASERERLILRLSGVESNQQRLTGRALFVGKSLAVYLGTTTLVLAPTEEFLRSPEAHRNESWVKLLRELCRIRSPRVLLCLSQTPIDVGALDEITAWASTLRAHVDLMAQIRNATIETNVVIVQAPRGGIESGLGITDAFFSLLRILGVYEGFGATQRIALDGLSQRLPLEPEEAKCVAKAFVGASVEPLGRAWPRLLAHSERPMPEVLEHVKWYEEFERFTTCLGASLAEVFASTQGKASQVVGGELRFLPDHEEAWNSALGLFATAMRSDGKWVPSSVVARRLRAATFTLLCAVLMSIGYASSKQEWEFVTKQALDYVPPEIQGKLSAVRDYSLQMPLEEGKSTGGKNDWFASIKRRMTWAAHEVYLKLTFFDRDLPRCVVVERTRSFLERNLVSALSHNETPESVLPLVALFLTGDPWDCENVESSKYAAHEHLKDYIDAHADQWGILTGLPPKEIEEYLALACPYQAAPLTILAQVQAYRGGPSGPACSVAPATKGFAVALQTLRGGCALEAKERDALVEARRFVDQFEPTEKSAAYGVAYETLKKLSGLDTQAATVIQEKFRSFETRFRELDELAFKHDELQLLVRDVRAIPRPSQWQAGEYLTTINRLLESQDGELPSADVDKVSLTFLGEDYVIDRRKVRTSALVDSLEQFRKTASEFGSLAGTPEALFFRPEEFTRKYSWIPPYVIPSGVILESAVPWRYTSEGFDAAIRIPVARLAAMANCATCRCEDGQQGKGEILRGIRSAATSNVAAYLAAYRKQWLYVYNGFRVNVTSETELVDALLTLTRPTSPQLMLMREAQRQTTLTVDDAAPWASDIAAVKATFEGLSGATDDKAFGEYQALILELANAAAEREGAGGARAPAISTGGAKPASAKRDPLDAFLQDLTGLARVVIRGAREPKSDLRTRVQAWLNTAKVPAELRRPFLQPVDSAYASGQASLTKVLREYWSRQRAKLEAELLSFYPFSPRSEVDASVSAVIAWLAPTDGKFFVEIAPVGDFVLDNASALEISAPSNLSETFGRLRALSRILFDAKGEPTTIAAKWEPVPFSPSQLKGSSLALGDVYERYFNTVPNTTVLSVPWTTEYVASIRVDLVVEAKGSTTTMTIPSRKSPWAFYHLLDLTKEATEDSVKDDETSRRKAATPLTRRTWSFGAASEAGTSRAGTSGNVTVSYRVCVPALGDERAKEVLRCN